MSKIENFLNENFDLFVEYLDLSQIDFLNKLGNLDEAGQLPAEHSAMEYVPMEKEAFSYIKEHVKDYKDNIIDETIKIKDKHDCTEAYDLSAGLYNTDELYLRAIGVA